MCFHNNPMISLDFLAYSFLVPSCRYWIVFFGPCLLANADNHRRKRVAIHPMNEILMYVCKHAFGDYSEVWRVGVWVRVCLYRMQTLHVRTCTLSAGVCTYTHVCQSTTFVCMPVFYSWAQGSMGEWSVVKIQPIYSIFTSYPNVYEYEWTASIYKMLYIACLCVFLRPDDDVFVCRVFVHIP